MVTVSISNLFMIMKGMAPMKRKRVISSPMNDLLINCIGTRVITTETRGTQMCQRQYLWIFTMAHLSIGKISKSPTRADSLGFSKIPIPHAPYGFLQSPNGISIILRLVHFLHTAARNGARNGDYRLDRLYQYSSAYQSPGIIISIVTYVKYLKPNRSFRIVGVSSARPPNNVCARPSMAVDHGIRRHIRLIILLE